MRDDVAEQQNAAAVQMSVWTAWLALALGIVTAGLMSSGPENVEPDAAAASAARLEAATPDFSKPNQLDAAGIAKSVAAPEPPAREPASDSAATSGPEPEITDLESGKNRHAQAAELKINCQRESVIRLPAAVSQVRLDGTFCGRRQNTVEPKTTILDKENSFSGTAFFMGGSSFTTDYISLDPGVNHISIKQAWPGGIIEERDISIERDAPETSAARQSAGGSPLKSVR